MNITHDVKDLPEDGLTIIAPSSPAFDKEMSALLDDADGRGRHFTAVRPFCVFMRNTSEQEVVAYKLKWELRNSDGRVKTRYSSALDPSKLMGETIPEGVTTGVGIKPGTSRLVTWDLSLEKILRSRKDKRNEATSPAAQKLEALLSQVGTTIRQQTESVVGVTVSVDGAFFADGTFVGPDADDTFAEVKGYVESKRELARLIETGRHEGKTPAEIVDQINSAYGDLGDTPGANPSPADLKNFFMKMHVNDFLRMREALGDDRAVSRTLLSSRAEEVRLRKRVK